MPKVDMSSEEPNVQVGVNDLKKIILELLVKYKKLYKKKLQDNNARRSILNMAKFIFIIDSEIDTYIFDSRLVYEGIFKPLANFYYDDNYGGLRREYRYSLNLTEVQTAFFAALSTAINIYPLEKINLNEEDAPALVEVRCREFVSNLKKIYTSAIGIVRDRREDELEKISDNEKGKFSTVDNTSEKLDKFWKYIDEKCSAIRDELEDVFIAEVDYIYDSFIPIVINAYKKHYFLDVKYTSMELALKQILKKVKKVDVLYKGLIFEELEKPLEIMLSKLNNVETEDDILREFFYNREMPDLDFSKLRTVKKQTDDSE